MISFFAGTLFPEWYWAPLFFLAFVFTPLVVLALIFTFLHSLMSGKKIQIKKDTGVLFLRILTVLTLIVLAVIGAIGLFEFVYSP